MAIFENKFVRFYDTLEDDPVENYGVLLQNGNILCLCCGGELEPEDYVILREIPWTNISVTEK